MTTNNNDPYDCEIVTPSLFIFLKGAGLLYPQRLTKRQQDQIGNTILELVTKAALEGKLLPKDLMADVTAVHVITHHKDQHDRLLRQLAYDPEIKRPYEDDTYVGKRFTYLLRVRPLAQFNVPDGWIIGSGKELRNLGGHGVVDYPFPLTKDQQQHYEMQPVLHRTRFHFSDGDPVIHAWTDGSVDDVGNPVVWADDANIKMWCQKMGFTCVDEDGQIAIYCGDDLLMCLNVEPCRTVEG